MAEDFPLEWYDSFDPGIRLLVRSLNSLKVGSMSTIWSCEGHIRTNPLYTGVLPWPWVVVHCNNVALYALQEIVEVWNETDPSYKWMLSTDRIHASLNPENYMAFLRALTPVEENMELSKDLLLALQSSAHSFAEFMLKIEGNECRRYVMRDNDTVEGDSIKAHPPQKGTYVMPSREVTTEGVHRVFWIDDKHISHSGKAYFVKNMSLVT